MTVNPASSGSSELACKNCRSTALRYSIEMKLIVCLSCRTTYPPGASLDSQSALVSLSSLSGEVYSQSASGVVSSDQSLVTVTCPGCHGQITVNTTEQLVSRCHWCRSTLSLDAAVPTGVLPDGILPFTITHEQAVQNCQAFAADRTFFADHTFKAEFSPENIVGVYLPYFVIDVKANVFLSGHGEVLTRRHDNGKSADTYDGDVYEVARRFGLLIDDHAVEANADKLNMGVNSNNVVNAVLPFDTQNAVPFDSRYLIGFTTQPRDVNPTDVRARAVYDVLSISRAQVLGSLSRYDRGVRWSSEQLDVSGVRWKTLLLPVWLYSYYHQTSSGPALHYIAVNGRSGETMGSIPINSAKLVGYTALVTFVLFVLAVVIVGAGLFS